MKTRRNMVKRWIAGVLAVTMLSSTMSTAAFAAPESTDAPETVETTRVTAWNWTDGSALTWQEDTSAWTLTLSEEQTISAEADLLALLPVSVEATLAQAETESTPAPDTAATPAPESTPDTEATEVTPTPVAEVDPVAEEGATAPAAAALAQPEEGTTGADTLSVEPQNNAEATPAPETATPAPTAAPQPAESPAPTADAEPTEEPAATETLTLAWDTDALTYPLAGGDYTVTATLPEGYALAEGVPALTVTVQVPGAEDEDVPAADNSLSGSAGAYAPSMLANEPNTIDTVSPVGTTINLFDYSVSDTNIDAEDDKFDDASWGPLGIVWYGNGDLGRGINANHFLKFSKSTETNHVHYGNKYEDGINRYPGIVANQLDTNGYPQLSRDVDGGWADTKNEKSKEQESLAYLFNPSDTYENKAYRVSYTNVKGLLKSEDGYYTYNSSNADGLTPNYAWFDPSSNSFKVYETAPENCSFFFPFNTYEEAEQASAGGKNADPVLNHYFGMTMTTRFVQQNGGISTKDGSTHITYEFAGDDDVWVFIDGALVGDVGGIHGKTSLKIDFSTGDIYINNERVSTLYDKYKDAGKLTATKWKDKTFQDNTYHTLQFFYLERGNYDSNLYLKFNMESTTASSINNVDQDGHGQAGITFDLYAANDKYQYGATDQPVYSNVTETDGVLNMTDKDGNNVKLSDLRNAGNYFVLHADAPAGYRSLADVHLYFMDNLDILLVENPTESGAYAAPAVTATLPQTVHYYSDSSKTVDTNNQDILQNGTFFAVVLKRGSDSTDETETWYPVYGNAMDGWQMGTKKASDLSGVIEAAQSSPYMFVADNTGLRATIENLPGDIQQYSYIIEQTNSGKKPNYTVAYYYATAGELDGATTENTHRLSTGTDGNNTIQREFSAHIYVPTVKNYVVVQGVTDDGTTGISGVKFGLYSSDQGTDNQDGTYSLNEGAEENPLDIVVTKDLNQKNGDSITLEGGGIFPTNSGVMLENGKTYYLKEIEGPDGYNLSDQVVKVVVDNSGVYVDAGVDEDSVTVLRGAGKIVRSMLQFAVPDSISTTLTDINAALLKASKEPVDENWDWSNSSVDKLSLSYHTSDVPLEYGLSNKGENEEDNAYFVVEDGWSKVEITQNYNKGNLVDSSLSVPNVGPKEDWSSEDLTDLFSRSTVVRVKNETQLCDLTINKIIESPVGNDSNREFVVNLTLTKDDDTHLTGEISVVVTGTAANDTTIQSPLNLGENGTVSVPIKLGQDVTFKDVPYGTKFTVTESALEDYTTVYSVTVTGDATVDSTNGSGTLTGDGIVTILNERKAGSVAVSNTVEGAMGSYSDTFSYTLKLYDKTADDTDPAIGGTYQATLQAKDGTLSNVTLIFGSDGTASQITPDSGAATPIQLKDGDTLTIAGLPAGATVEATEIEANQNGYTTTVAVSNQPGNSATVPNSADANPTPTIAFTNTREAIVPTGMREENNPYIVMIGLAGMAALVGAAGWVEMRRRKRREEE